MVICTWSLDIIPTFVFSIDFLSCGFKTSARKQEVNCHDNSLLRKRKSLSFPVVNIFDSSLENAGFIWGRCLRLSLEGFSVQFFSAWRNSFEIRLVSGNLNIKTDRRTDMLKRSEKTR